MKYSLIVLCTLFISPLHAGVNCMESSENLTKSYDTKALHLTACNCPCTTIRNGRCVECTHLQDAHEYTIINSHDKQTHNRTATTACIATPKAVFKKLVAQFFIKKLSPTTH
jgi:hypothetical protein